MSLTVETTLDWTVFARRHWDRQPVLFTSVDPPPFEEREVFAAAVSATGPAHQHRLPPNVQFTIERHQQTRPGGHLPTSADGSFDGYRTRLAGRLDGRRYALVVHGFHGFHHPQWTRERDFFAGLWHRVGQPLTGGITTLFHGTYEHSPVGVHRDRFATFMFGLRGRKRMRFWPARPWTEPVTTVLDYQPYVADSFCVDVEPGQLLYWPSRYYHVGESAGDEPATSVNVGVPREEHQIDYDLDDLLLGTGRGSLPDDGLELLPTVEAPLCTPDGQPPAALELALAQLRATAEAARSPGRLLSLSLRHATAGGLRPVPPPAPVRPLPDSAGLRASTTILHAPDDGAWICAANGHTTRTTVDAPRLLEPLRHGQTVTVGELLAPLPGDGGRQLLQTLESFHALERAGG